MMQFCAHSSGQGIGGYRGSPRSLRRCRPMSIVCSALEPAVPGSSIGFLGNGIMGVPMAKNLIAAGYEVVVWNRTPEKCIELKDLGASVMDTPAEVAKGADYIFAMLADDEAAQAVLGGPEGVCSTISGKGYIDMSTVSVPAALANAEVVAEAGGMFLEAPVSGSKAPAVQGQLIFLAGGSKELYDAVAAPLDVMGKAKFFLGEAGKGTKMKLAVNLLMGTMMASFAENLNLAESVGLSGDDFVEILGLGAMANPMFALKGPAMLRGEYPPAFPFKHQLKDIEYALDMADDASVETYLGAVAGMYYSEDTDNESLADADFSAVLEVVRVSSLDFDGDLDPELDALFDDSDSDSDFK